MKLVIVALCCLAVALAAPAPQDVQIVSYENDNSGLGQYRFGYELTDGTKRQEQGELRNPGTDNEAMYVTGSYSWVSPDGTVWTVEFVADENGFQPKVSSVGGTGIISGPIVASLLG